MDSEEEYEYEDRLLLAIRNNDIDIARQIIDVDQSDIINDVTNRDDGEITIHLREAKFHERKEIAEMIIDSPVFDPEECSMNWGSNVINAILESDEDETFEDDFKIKLIKKILKRIIEIDDLEIDNDDDYIVNFLNNVLNYHENRNTPLITAIIFWNGLKIIKFLLKKGADPNIFSKYDSSHPLSMANTRLDVCKLLIKYGANPNMKIYKDNGKTPFMRCVSTEYTTPDVLDYLAKKSDIDIQDNLGNTALMHCIIKANDNHRFDNFVYILLRHNPEINIRNNNGQTVFDIIGPNLSPHIVDILHDYRRTTMIYNTAMQVVKNPHNEYSANIDDFSNILDTVGSFLDGKKIKKKSVKKSVKKIVKKSVKKSRSLKLFMKHNK